MTTLETCGWAPSSSGGPSALSRRSSRRSNGEWILDGAARDPTHRSRDDCDESMAMVVVVGPSCPRRGRRAGRVRGSWAALYPTHARLQDVHGGRTRDCSRDPMRARGVGQRLPADAFRAGLRGQLWSDRRARSQTSISLAEMTFRNLGAGLSSDLIEEATEVDEMALGRALRRAAGGAPAH